MVVRGNHWRFLSRKYYDKSFILVSGYESWVISYNLENQKFEESHPAFKKKSVARSQVELFAS